MLIDKQLNKTKFFYRASRQQRLVAGLVFLGIIAVFAFLWLSAKGIINIGLLFGPCGFKQRYGLPCPTCGITTSAIAFASGQVLKAFYIQPAGAFFCCIMVVSAFFALFTTVFGVYFVFLKRFFDEVKAKYIILALVIIIAAGWIVTLARALAAGN